MDWTEIAVQGVFSALPALIVGLVVYNQTERIRKVDDAREEATIHRRTTGLLIAVMKELHMLLERVRDLPINADTDSYPVPDVVKLIRNQYGDLDVDLSRLIETGYGHYAHFCSRPDRDEIDFDIAKGSLQQAFDSVKTELSLRGLRFS